MKNQTLQRQFQMWTILLIVVPSMLIMSIYTIGQIAIAKQQNLELIRQRVHSQERLIDYWMGERAISVRELSQTEAFQKLDEREMRAALELKQHSDQKFDSLSYIHKLDSQKFSKKITLSNRFMLSLSFDTKRR